VARATAAAAVAAAFLRAGRFFTRTGGGESGKLLGHLRGTAVRTFRALPVGGAHEDFGILLTFPTMKFVDRHAAKVIGPVRRFKRAARKKISVYQPR